MPLAPVSRDQSTEEFFDAAARREFLVKKCSSCGAYASPQAQRCEVCRSTDLERTPATGQATLVSWTVVHHRGRDGEEKLQVAAIAELAEGPWWWAELIDSDGTHLQAGLPLTVDFQTVGDGEAIPVFRPDPTERLR